MTILNFPLSVEEKKIFTLLSSGKFLTAREISISIKNKNIESLLDTLVQKKQIEKENYNGFYYFHLDAENLNLDLQDRSSVFSKKIPTTDIRYCRTCYGHLAGKIGVAVADQLLKLNLLKLNEHQFELTQNGEHFFTNLGIDLAEVEHQSGIFAKTCLDFSERRFHLGGRLGVAFFKKIEEKGWVKKTPNSRLISLTEIGKTELVQKLDLNPELFTD